MSFLPSMGGFNPNMMSLNDLASISPMKDAAMGMINRTGQEMMGQGGDANVGTENNPVNNAIYQMMAQGLQGLARRAEPQQQPTQQIIRDSNQFRFAGMQQNPQMLAQALRRRG